MSSSEDFFSNELSGPPSGGASRPSASTTLRTRPNKTRPAPPPPPPRAAATTTTTTTATTARSNLKSTATKPTTSTAPPRPLPTSRASRAAPVRMNRPVGQYYASDTTATASAASTTATASITASATSTEESADAWDWNSPAKATPSPNLGANVNNWAAAPSNNDTTTSMDTSASTGNDWYSAGQDSNSQPTTTASNPYPAPTANNTTVAPMNQANFYGTAMDPSQQFQQPSTTQQPNTMQPQASQQQPSFLSGSMDGSSTAPTILQPQQFMPTSDSLAPMRDSTGNISFSDEPPLLEELGINLNHIAMKTRAVILPFSRFGGDAMEPSEIVQDADLAGPLAFALVLGAEMVLAGKLQFGYIYGFGLFGCLSMTLVVNLMSPQSEAVSLWTVSSVLGYALLPVNLLAAIKLVIINLIHMQTLGQLLGLFTVAWSTISSTRLLELGCGLRDQRYLIAYPIALLYSAFVLITIF